jgi:hypothetical protein
MSERNFEKIMKGHGTEVFHFYYKDEKMLYCKNKGGKEGTVYLRCIEKDCRCRAKIQDNRITRTNSTNHQHGNHQDQATFGMAYEYLKTQAVETKRSLRELHAEELRKLSKVAAGMLSWDRVRCTLFRLRSQTMPHCDDLDDFVAHMEVNLAVQDLCKIRGDDFYIGAVGKSVVFGNQELITELPKEFDLFVDGTFSVTPFHAPQLLILMAEIYGSPRPIVYVIMRDRVKTSYADLFDFFDEALFCHKKPRTFMSDFERAARSAGSEVWPDIELIGCFFHFCQALRRKAASLPSLSTRITGDTDHHNGLKMFMRLALLPLDRVLAGLEALKTWLQEKQIEEDFTVFLQYFEKVWIRHNSPATWCVSSRKRRTNCNIEGYNRFVKQQISRNPSPWQFLAALQDLALYASSNLQNDIKNKTKPKDRSHLSIALSLNLKKLNLGAIDELQFLHLMKAKKPHNN